MKRKVAILDDDADMRDLLVEQLHSEGYAAQATGQPNEAVDLVLSGDADVLLTDLRMPGPSGIDICQHVHDARPDVPVIVMTAFGTVDSAVNAIRAGAHDFLSKPFELEQLLLRLERAFEHRHLTDEVRRLRRVTGDVPGFEGMIGTSTPMQRLYDLIERVGRAEVSVLILGESGTGKELVARALHQVSRRRSGPFVPLNCAAVPEALLESELFGHARGAFTDARTERKGLLREADQGTVFLDEIGDLSGPLQPKLLRALQERRVRPVGGDTEVPINARIIAATHHHLKDLVESGQFRQDLFYRLAVITVEVPPLRERGDDILLLAEVLAERTAQREQRPPPCFSDDVLRCMRNYSWPGNVRELSNCIERCIALAEGTILVSHLPPEIADSCTPEHCGPPSEQDRTESDAKAPTFLPLFEVERRHILRVIDAVDGNKSQAARMLGIDRKTLQARLVRYGRAE